jgi:hypothetical protein
MMPCTFGLGHARKGTVFGYRKKSLSVLFGVGVGGGNWMTHKSHDERVG